MRLILRPTLWIGLAVSGGGLFLAFRGLRWAQVGEALADANYWFLLLALGVLLLGLYFRALRWATLFHPRQGMRTSNLLGAMSLGYALNNVLPLRVGELARAYLIGRTENLSATHALSTIVVERVLDTLTVLALLTITLPFVDAPSWAKGPALLLGLGVLLLAIVLGALSSDRKRVMALVSWASPLLPERLRERAEQAVDGAIEGLTVLRRPKPLARAIGWSAAVWLVSAVFTFLVMRAFGLDLPFTAGIFVTATTSLAMVVPSSPGYIGVFHAIAIESLVNVFDANRNSAASYALVHHAIGYLTPIVIGALFLWKERGAWEQLRLWADGRAATRTVVAPAGESGGNLADRQE